MTDKQHEILSVVMDNEASDIELQKFLQNDGEINEEMKAKWADYHLVGDIMRNDVGNSINFCLADKIEAALQDEAPLSANVENEVKSNVVKVTFGTKVKQWADEILVSPAARYSSQFAIAATVAAVSVLGVQQFNQASLDDGNSPLPVLQINPVTVGSASPVSLSTNNVQKPQPKQFSNQQLRLNALMLDHQRQLRLKPQEESKTDAEKDNEVNQ